MLGRQVQTKEADVDHEIGEETGARKSHIVKFHNMKLGKKLVPENLIFHNMKNKKLVKKLVPENPPKTGNFGTQQAFLNLVRMMEMILNQQESWQC